MTHGWMVRGTRQSLLGALFVTAFAVAAVATGATAVLASTATPTETPLPCTLLFFGRVTDSISGGAIGGASLCLNSGFCTQTDPTGAYAGLCYPGASSAGTQLCAEAAGYKKACQGPWTPTGESMEVNFALEPVATPTPTPTTAIVDHPTPTPTPTATPTFTPTSCVSDPPLVYPVTSPTDQLTQTITGYSPGLLCPRGGFIEISGVEVLAQTQNCAQGTFEATIQLQPDQTNAFMVCLRPGLCGSGGCTPVEIRTVGNGICTGDCDGDHSATVDEVMTLVNIALGNAALSACPVGDRGGDGQITIDDLIAAVQNVLTGCPSPEPRFRVSGHVAEFPGCMGHMRGVSVVLDPLGLTTQTQIGPDPGVAGTFAFEEVPPGDYTLTINPACNPYGCWPPTSVRVVDGDVSVQICNVAG